MRKTVLSLMALWAGMAWLTGTAQAQQAGPPSSQPVRQIGVVTEIQPGRLTLHTDAGPDLAVLLPDGVTVVRVPPGAKDLKTAVRISVSDINVGDRVMIRGKASDDQKSWVAASVIVMSKTALESAHEAERLDWQRRGIGGVVKAVDPAAKEVTISVPNTPPTPGNPTHPLTIGLAPNAVLERYAPDSVKFSDAKPSTLENIKVGDQVRALGTKSGDGSRFTAEKLVWGTFRNIAATVISVDVPNTAVTVKDLATGKPVLVRTNADSKMHTLTPFIAQMIAAFNSGNLPAGGMAGRSAGGGAAGGAGRGMGGGMRDFQQMLDHMPPLTMAELKPGDPLIVVSTEGAKSAEVTAIVVLAGVEPILSARPKGSSEVVLGPWNMTMGGGGGTGEAEAGP